MYILDTNTLIYYFKGMGRVAEQLLNTPPRDTAIPSIVLYELEVGLAGTPIGSMDTLIAGTAWAHQGILVTHNTKEFSRIDGLQLNDWY